MTIASDTGAKVDSKTMLSRVTESKLIDLQYMICLVQNYIKGTV